MKLEIYTLDEAARAMILADPQEKMCVPDARLPRVIRALAGIVEAIIGENLSTVRLPSSTESDRTILTEAYLDALANPDDGGPGIDLSSAEKSELCEIGIALHPLIGFAKQGQYDAPSLPGAAASRLARQRHEQANAPYDDAVSEAVTLWSGRVEWKHKEMRNFLIRKDDYSDLDPGKLLRKLKDAANSHGWRHLAYGTDEQRIYDRRSGF